MNTDRWARIAETFQRAIEHEPALRSAHLDEVCRDDPELRREVETLLAGDQSAGILDSPVWAAASTLLEQRPSLAPGAALGPYRIDGLVGIGGMGEVFRATDTRLDRAVAIKILSGLSADRELSERFDREARASAALAHPHICTLYDVGVHDGVHFIVTEYLAGATLAEQLDKGPLPLDRAVRHAIEIAGALDHAHRHGIVHRDVKPANIVLTAGGAKLMDFGIAQLQPTAPANVGSTTLTEQGAVLGTVHYMAPEQVEGQSAVTSSPSEPSSTK